MSTSILGSGLSPSLSSNGWREYTDVIMFPAGSVNGTLFGPAGGFDSKNGMGQLYGGTASELARGHWGSGGQVAAYAGIFAIGLNGAGGPDKTFRCVYAPQVAQRQVPRRCLRGAPRRSSSGQRLWRLPQLAPERRVN